MSPFDHFSAARPRVLRSSRTLKTPDPHADYDVQPPTPPKPRFRLRRRNASQLNAPTQQFLASVAAADVPIPSVEEPCVLDEDMTDSDYQSLAHFGNDGLSFPHIRGRTFSPPKTPAPGAAPSLSPVRFPNWSLDATFSSLESSPECESSRPSTSHSTQTSDSLFSRVSFTSEDLSQCVSPELEKGEKFGGLLTVEDADKTIKAPPPKPRRAPWTRAMSQHLWATYMMYLQDPQVTPFRIGKSGIPPHGVCLRVSREAKRSWKGSKSQKADRADEAKSGSITPTEQRPAAFVRWPHTCAATRAHLRELCKANAGTTTRNHQYMAHSPTPFGRTATRFWNRRSAPLRSPSVFSGSDMAMSLVVSTCESMQRQGPLAQLTSSLPETHPEDQTPDAVSAGNASLGRPKTPEPRTGLLASPFIARSYGPSSSTSLVGALASGPAIQRQHQTVGHKGGLQSPLRLGNHNHSRSSTHKRRSRPSALEPREPRRIKKRPSLASDFWTDPSAIGDRSQSVGPLLESSSTSRIRRDNHAVPRTNIQELFEASRPQHQYSNSVEAISSNAISQATRHLEEPPARLGSPFSAKQSSFSFPNRLSNVSVIDFGAIRRPFATVQQSADSAGAAAPRSSLASRLAYIDERLKDLHRRDENPTSSSSLQ